MSSQTDDDLGDWNMTTIVCDWCQTNNSAQEAYCVACGAPLEKTAIKPAGDPPPSPRPVSKSSISPGASVPLGGGVTTADLKQVGDSTERLFYGALNAYGMVWQTLAEAIAIGVTALLLGLVGAALRNGLLALLGAVVLGLLVGLLRKNLWLTMLGAPFGALLGAGLWLLPWSLGAGPGGMLPTSWFFAMLGAVIGGRRAPRPGWWDKLRPFLGALGGLAFGLLGLAFGAGARWIAVALMRAIQVGP